MQAYLVPCWWVVWWLWRAGCISQDTYLLYHFYMIAISANLEGAVSPTLTMDMVLLSVRLLLDRLSQPWPKENLLVGVIAKLLVQNKEEHERTTKEWTTRYA